MWAVLHQFEGGGPLSHSQKDMGNASEIECATQRIHSQLIVHVFRTECAVLPSRYVYVTQAHRMTAATWRVNALCRSQVPVDSNAHSSTRKLPCFSLNKRPTLR